MEMRNAAHGCVAVIASTLLSMFWPFNCLADVLEIIKERRYMVIAHREASFPFSFVDGNGAVRGYSIDLCMQLVDVVRRELKLTELPIRLLPVTSANRITKIAAHDANLECGSTTNNAERRKLVDYTIPHFISASRFLVRSGRNLQSIDDLREKTVVSTKGTTNLSILRRLNGERNLNMKIEEVAEHSDGFNAVASDKAMAFAMDDVLLYGLRAAASAPRDFEVMGKAMSIEPYAIMLPKGESRFKALIDREMQRIVLSGEIVAIYKKWFESPVPPTGVNLELRMPYALRNSFLFPTSRVNDWYLD